jgi:hypothetical protein
VLEAPWHDLFAGCRRAERQGCGEFRELGAALADLRDAITKSQAAEADKMNYVADIETVQSQLAKAAPNRGIISAAWSAIKGAAVIAECIPLVERVHGFIAPFINN